MMSDFAPVAVGGETWFARSLATVAEDLRDCRPTVFFAVPRVWEKFQEAVVAKVADEHGLKRLLVGQYLGLGVHAMDALSRCGLFIDMGAIYRCVGDSISEVYFLLEHYPEQSATVEKFLTEFFSHTIDSDLSFSGDRVPQSKIHNAVIRCLPGKEQDAQLKKSLTNIFRTYSGYIHSGYANIMEMYGGPAPHLSFNISGIQSQEQQGIRTLTVVEAYRSVIFAIGHVAARFGREELFRDVRSAC
jgi:hypothetical protein